MKKMLLFVVLLSIGSFIPVGAQDVPQEILGEWSYQYELDICGNDIPSGCDMEGLIITQYNDNPDLDTLMITELKAPNETYSARYVLTVNPSNPEQVFFVHVDSVNTLNPFDFLSTYHSDSLIFNWTTTDPGAIKYFKLLSPDSLVFHWETDCEACYCSGAIHFARNQTSNSSPVLSASEAWKLYPNPAKHYVSLEKVGTINSSEARFSLIDSKGSVHQEWVSSAFNVMIPLADLSFGIYYLKIEDETGFVIKKIVVADDIQK